MIQFLTIIVLILFSILNLYVALSAARIATYNATRLDDLEGKLQKFLINSLYPR